MFLGCETLHQILKVCTTKDNHSLYLIVSIQLCRYTCILYVMKLHVCVQQTSSLVVFFDQCTHHVLKKIWDHYCHYCPSLSGQHALVWQGATSLHSDIPLRNHQKKAQQRQPSHLGCRMTPETQGRLTSLAGGIAALLLAPGTPESHQWHRRQPFSGNMHDLHDEARIAAMKE